MNNVLYHLHPVKVKRHGLKLTYTFCLGGLSFFLFILLTITGIFLMFFYRPMADIGGAQAYTDMQNIRTSVFFGDLVRNLHRWGAHLMVFSVTLHMARVFYTGAYKPPREFNWVVGVVLLFLTLGPVVHRLPAAVGPAGDLGGHGRHVARRLLAVHREAGELPAAGRRRRRAANPAPLVRAPRARAAVRAGALPRGPLLADPQGRRHLGTALDGARREDMAKEDTPLDQGVFDSTLEAELAKGDRPPRGRRARALRGRPRLPRRQPGGGGQARRTRREGRAGGAAARRCRAAAARRGRRSRPLRQARLRAPLPSPRRRHRAARARRRCRPATSPRRRRAPRTSTACWPSCRRRASSASSASRATA